MLVPLLLAVAIATPDLRLEVQRESLTGTHYRYRQYIDGIPVHGGEVNVTVRPDGSREERRDLAKPAQSRLRSATSGAGLVWINEGGVARLARREITGPFPVERFLDVDDGRVIAERPLHLRAKPAAVFDPNPVTRLNAPALQDLNDSPAAVPPAAYSIVELRDLNATGPIGGPWVQITELQGPAVPPADVSADLIFDRSQSGFEDVNAYFHIDRSQRHLRSLGYAGMRALVPYAIPVDTHSAGGTDNSFFIAASSGPGRGSLHFGEGGTDDAEDSDLVVHEYAHAIHEWIAPGTFLASSGNPARAISEGFGDYWALSAEYAAAIESGRDPFCFADWDARCEGDNCAYPAGSDCLRRLDSTKTVDDYIEGDAAGTEHRNGEIWSSALAEIFVALTARYGVAEGRRVSDVLAIESFFGTPPNPTFETIARQMLAAERFVTGGVNRDVLCAAMSRRGIIEDCAPRPRGEVTLFPGDGSGVIVPDNSPQGVTLSSFVNDARRIEELMVSVNIRHSGRGELRVQLIGPDGTTVRLVESSPDRSPDLVTTFGRDSVPIDSLDGFRGRSAAGEWRLRVIDVAFRDVATVISWSLVIRFEGDSPQTERPSDTGPRQVIPVVGRTPGMNGTFFTTDVRLFNPNNATVEATLVFTPAAAEFLAVTVVMPPGEVVAFDDVVRTLFASGGLGHLEIAGDVIASSRTWTTSPEGTYGLFAAASPVEDAIGSGETAHIAHLRNDAAFRSNIGFAEVDGRTAAVSVSIGGEIFRYDVAPHGHVQVPVPVAGSILDARITVEGEGRVLAYGAVVDNQSGDPILIPASRATASGMVPGISSGGVAGTYWRTDIAVTPPATLRYTTATGTVDRAVSEPTRAEDAVADFFGRPSSSGTITAGGAVSARIWTRGPNGTYGLFAPFREPSSSAFQHILHIERSLTFRTNIGLLSDVTSRVRVTIMDGDGHTIETHEHDVHPFQLVQFPVLQPVFNGRALVEPLNGRVYAYAALVDNRTGDPIFIPAAVR
jgi:subtilisin-like proprotein convertase family protein